MLPKKADGCAIRLASLFSYLHTNRIKETWSAWYFSMNK